MYEPVGLLPVNYQSYPAIDIGPGCIRRDLPSRPGVRIWVVEIAAGAQWPRIDEHDAQGEDVFVVDGELIEGSRRFPVGTYLHFEPGSSHQPRSDTGVRLIGLNLVA